MPSAAPIASVAPSSPPPPDVEHDRSGGYRAYVTLHALRRYGDRILGLEEALADLDDMDAVDAMQAIGVDLPAIRRWIAFYGGVAVRHGAHGVCRDGIGLVIQGGSVVTVLSRRSERRRRA